MMMSGYDFLKSHVFRCFITVKLIVKANAAAYGNLDGDSTVCTCKMMR